MALLDRHAKSLINEALADTRIVVIQGARQVGKSTLAQEVLRPDDRYVTLDAPTELAAANADPTSYAQQLSDRCLAIDEVQKVPALVPAIKAVVDRDQRPGRFLLTGSANLLRLPTTEDSLAGRAESIELYGLSQGELEGHKETTIDRLFDGDLLVHHAGELSRAEYLDRVCAGGYPEALSRTLRRRQRWFEEYARRIVERDAPDLSNLRRLGDLPTLLHLVAAHNASEVAIATLSNQSQIPERTLPPYLDLLEVMYLIQRLPAWSNNLSNRVAQRPKIALLDGGLAAQLTNVSARSLAANMNPEPAGMLVEAFVMSELRKQITWSETRPRMFHFRDRRGHEVDVVLESSDGRVVGIECKASATLGGDDFRWLIWLRDKLPNRFVAGVVLYTGDATHVWGDRLVGLPLSALWRN